MLRQNLGRQTARSLSAWALCAAAACGTALTIRVVSAPRPPHKQAANKQAANEITGETRAVVQLTPVGWYVPQTPNVPEATPAVKVEVEAANAQASDLAALREALGDGVSLPESAGAGGQDNAVASDALPAWFTWGRLGGKRAPVRIAAPADLPANALGVYAVREEAGVSLCLVNKTEGRVLTNALVRLPRGVYCVERLLVSRNEETRQGEQKQEPTPGQEKREDGAVSAASSPPSASASSSVRLERLEGCDLGGATAVSKGLCLEPGQMCVYRYTDMARTARVAWYDVFSQLNVMARDHAGPARRLGTMLHEADGYLSGVRGNARHEGLEGRLGCIHHLLLVTAQAHSLHHNYQMRHTVDEAEGKAVMGALDRLTDALSETSAVLLGLVPQITTATPPLTAFFRPFPSDPSDSFSGLKSAAYAGSAPSGGRLTGKEEKTPRAANHASEAADKGRVVTVALANTGAQTVRNVKLGLNMGGLPDGVICEPADPAYFDALHPGQTVRAAFRVRIPDGQELPNAALKGDVSYFAGTAPAHLRPRAW